MGPKNFMEEIVCYVGGEIADENGVFWDNIGLAIVNTKGGPIEPQGVGEMLGASSNIVGAPNNLLKLPFCPLR